MANATVLLVSRDSTLIESVEEALELLDDVSLEITLSFADAAPSLLRKDIALLLAHVSSPEDAEWVPRLMRDVALYRRTVSTLVIGDVYDAEQALDLLRMGAADYLDRPVNLARLSYLADVLTLRARTAPAEAPEPVAGKVETVEVGDSERSFVYVRNSSMGHLMGQVERVAPLDANILLLGETGTGKTRLARVIHALSPRRDQPFLVINCGALSATLIESEMFGHVRGSFTGADRDRTGKFADVGRGTLLLDEIDSLSPELQAKLLRVVEDRVFESVGSNRSLPLEARLIVASNRPLEREVAAGRFRSDLYYRLNVVSFYLPPLRERPQTLAVMVEQFIKEFAARMGRDSRGISPRAMAALEQHDWPGNIRELRNAIERAVALSTGPRIELADLPESLHPLAAEEPAPLAPALAAPHMPVPVPAGATLAEMKEATEAALIRDALRRNNNNRLRAAAELGISRMTLYTKMHRYGLMSATV